MHLKIETLRLNDEDQNLETSHVKPNQTQICDEVVRWWKEVPDAEELLIEELFQQLVRRRPNWLLTQNELYRTLKSLNLYSAELDDLDTYSDQIKPSTLRDVDMNVRDNKKLLDKVTIAETEFGKGLLATKDISKGTLIFHEPLPVSVIPQLDKQPLVDRGKCCGLCSTFTTLSSQMLMKNNLDCEMCNTIWCCKQCKKLDVTHSILKHPTNRNGYCNSSNWKKFEEFCLKESLNAAYSVGVLYARHLIQPSSDLWKTFTSLCSVSQRVRWQASDSINVGGTFDASLNGKLHTESSLNSIEAQCEAAFQKFMASFPKCELKYENFLELTGSFNLNQIQGQIYPLTAHINHSCDPNVRYNLEPKYGIKIYARKDIKRGEQLFLTYVNPLHGVTLRRRELRVNYGFLCNCPRCLMEWDKRRQALKHSNVNPDIERDTQSPLISAQTRRKSSMKSSKPTLKELLENGHEFDLEIPSQLGSKRRTSVRFNSNVTMAVEEE